MMMVQFCAMAQTTKDVELCLKAEEAYRIGRFDEAVNLLESNLNELTSRTRETAYRLLTLCYMEKDQNAKAQSYAELLLKENPYFTVNLSDPIRFADMVENMKRGKVATITTASQQAESVEETPVPVTLITEEMIKAAGARNLKEVLVTFVPGMTDIESNEELNVAMRGIYTSSQEKILFLLNGHRINSYSTNASSPDYSISLEKVKQIEVLRGPASSLYGGVALTAVVNVITKEASDIDGIQVGSYVGNHGQVQANVLLGKQYLDWKIFCWGSLYNASGEKVFVPEEEQKYGTLPVEGDIVLGGFNQKPSHDFGINISLKDFNFMYNNTFSKSVAPYSMSFFFAPYSYDNYRTIDGNKPGYAIQSQHMNISYTRQIDDFFVKVAATYDSESQSRYQVGGDTIPNVGFNAVYPIGTQDSILILRGAFQYHNFLEYSYGVSLSGGYNYDFGKGQKGNINAGLQFNRFTLDDSYYLEGDNYNRILITYGEAKNLYTGRETSVDAYVQVKHRFSDLFIMNAGLRYDYKRRTNGQTINEYSPRLSFVLLQPKWNLKLSYAKSFVDAPYFYRNNTLDTTTGGEDLLSEYLHSYQLTFLGTKFVPNFEFEVNVYYNRATDFITQDGLGYTNAGILETTGVELSANYHINRFKAWANATWQHVISSDKYAVKDSYMYNIPKLNSNLILSYELFKNFSVNTGLNLMSKQYTLFKTYNEKGEVLEEVIDIPSRLIWNCNFQYSIKRCALGFQMSNILNKKYYQGGSSVAPIQQKGRWMSVSVSYKF